MRRAGTEVLAAAQRVVVVSGYTWRLALSQRLWWAIGLMLLGLIVSAQWLLSLDLGGLGPKLVAEFGAALISWLGLFLAVVLTVQQVTDERSSGALGLLCSRPLRRVEYVVGKWLGVTGVLVGYALAGLIVAVTMARVAEGASASVAVADARVPMSMWWMWTASQVMKCSLVVALTLLVVSLLPRLTLALVIAALLLVACHLQPVAADVLRVSGVSGWGRVMAWIVDGVPNLARFDVQDHLFGKIQPTWTGVFSLVLYAATYLAAGLLSAWMVVRARDA